MRRFVPVLALALVLAGCGTRATVDVDDIDDLPTITATEARTLLETSDRPVVFNVWASWCGPCRSEAPLLRRAHDEYGDEVRFVGIDVRDDQAAARSFIAEFGLEGFDHFFDRTGDVPADLGGIGVPQTWFFAAGGALVYQHNGVIDERTLALQIDELLRAG